MKIISFGMSLDMDFGHPSLLQGLWRTLQKVDEKNELIHYQFTPVDEKKTADCAWQLKSYNTSYKHMLTDYVKWKTHLSVSPEAKAFFEDLKAADLVIDPFGIRFCDKFCKFKATSYNMARHYLSEFLPFILARRMKKKMIKAAASYGPISNPATVKSARYMGNKIYSFLIAREEESKKQLLGAGIKQKEIPVSPDMANLFEVERETRSGLVGLSVSFIMERSFPDQASYVNSMATLCRDLMERYGVRILLIPNQTLKDKRDDVTIAEDVHKKLSELGLESEVLDLKETTGTDVKRRILSCEAVIASRYHTCVAALSGGVPLLVLGWHHKYTELLHLYHQDKFIQSADNFDLPAFEELFDDLWKNRETIASEIAAQKQEVQQKVVDVLKEAIEKNV